jgi:undecaprenyl-diphosphatase
VLGGIIGTTAAADTEVLRAINGGLGSFADAFFPFITNPDNFVVPAVLAVIVVAILGRSPGRWTLVAIGLSVLVSEQIVNVVLKPIVARTRPCNLLDDLRLLAGYSSGFSFPSSHAANVAAVAAAVSVRHRHSAWIVVTLAFLIGLSRVYVGVHYPVDVLGGFIVGAGCGIAAGMGITAVSKIAYRRKLVSGQHVFRGNG